MLTNGTASDNLWPGAQWPGYLYNRDCEVTCYGMWDLVQPDIVEVVSVLVKPPGEISPYIYSALSEHNILDSVTDKSC